MKQLWQRIKRTLENFIKLIHGHKLDCCDHVTYRCKGCPFNTEEVKKIVKEHKKKEETGYFTIKGGKND